MDNESKKWTVQATDADTLQQVGNFHEGDLDGLEAGDTVELSDGGYLAEFHLYDMSLEPATIGFDRTAAVRLAEPANTYRDVFTTQWEACDID